jgi:hypothetical protein
MVHLSDTFLPMGEYGAFDTETSGQGDDHDELEALEAGGRGSVTRGCH